MENTLGKRIAANRKRMGMTQEQLAEKLGITAQAVSKWENDQSCPDISVLPLLADIFGVSTDLLLGRVQMPVESATCSDFPDAEDDPTGEHHVHINLGTNDEPNNGKLHLIGLATLFLTVGVLFLLSKLWGWKCTFWDILWPSSLLVFGVFGLFCRISLFRLACTGVGTFFLINNFLPLPLELDKGILWAGIIILCGVMLLLDALRSKHRRRFHIDNNSTPSHEHHVTDNFLYCINAFDEQNQLVTADMLTGGKISNSFGEYTVDLTGVDTISENCTIQATCRFGELNLHIPKRYEVICKASKAFAAYSVDGKPDDVPEGQIRLNASISFGEITVTYV